MQKHEVWHSTDVTRVLQNPAPVPVSAAQLATKRIFAREGQGQRRPFSFQTATMCCNPS
jgi:hypothetical protein